MDPKQTNRQNLSLDQIAQLDAYDARKQQVDLLGKVNSQLSELKDLIQADVSTDKNEAARGLLTEVVSGLKELSAKPGPEPVDLSPVVNAIKDLAANLDIPAPVSEFKPDIHVDAPAVNVPAIDTTGVESVLRSDLPKAMGDLLKKLPKPAPVVIPDNSKLLQSIISTLEQVRDRPIPIPTPPSNVGILANNGQVSTANPLPMVGAFAIPHYTNGAVAYPDAVTEVYSFYLGASLVATVTITYVDATKAQMATWSIT